VKDQEKFVYTSDTKLKLCEEIATYYNCDVVTRKQINEYVDKFKIPQPHFLNMDSKYKEGWGKYRLRTATEPVEEFPAIVDTIQPTLLQDATVPVVSDSTSLIHRGVRIAFAEVNTLIPEKDLNYIPFGFYNDLRYIVESKIFYPVYITGLSGNGKTMMVEQICADLGRELIRVNITKETDELDLIGSYELIDGNTIRREGPVVIAMRRGAVLLLDETDYGSERLLCLQPILEGKGFFDKKTGEYVKVMPGFNIIATANTKGKGSDDGRFIGANVLNEAFLERFAITVEQDYPSVQIETKILKKNFESMNIEKDDQFINHLVNWADQIRITFAQQAIDEIISTRRLVHIVRAYGIFKSRKKAIQLCLNRFDEETKVTFLDLYTKIDADAEEILRQKEAKEADRKAGAEELDKMQPDVSQVTPNSQVISKFVQTLPPISNNPVFSDKLMKDLLSTNHSSLMNDLLAGKSIKEETKQAMADAITKQKLSDLLNQPTPKVEDVDVLTGDVVNSAKGSFSGTFGDIKNLAEVSKKYNVVIKLNEKVDINGIKTGDVEVFSHGKSTVAAAARIIDYNKLGFDLLDEIVKQHSL